MFLRLNYLGGWGNWSRGSIPTSRQLSEWEEKHLRLKVKPLICSKLKGMRIRQSLLQYTQDRDAGPLEGAVAGSWSLWIGEQSQGEGCCRLWRDRLRGCWGGDCGGKCLWKKARQPLKQGDTAESHIFHTKMMQLIFSVNWITICFLIDWTNVW